MGQQEVGELGDGEHEHQVEEQFDEGHSAVLVRMSHAQQPAVFRVVPHASSRIFAARRQSASAGLPDARPANDCTRAPHAPNCPARGGCGCLVHWAKGCQKNARQSALSWGARGIL
jgi:hypothetical protein